MEIKLFDSELKVMEALWREGDLSAGQLAKLLKEETGWNRNTTYTVIKKLIEKNAIERVEPNFVCKALVSKEQVQEQETMGLINKMFDGSAELFFSSFINEKNLTKAEIDKLKQIVERLK
ncbi:MULTISPECIES: BlaI/MecI/CopY family transcriptional regulator [unclassified Paenibacillus]|uniref:BlaI/MecI/CopY family transcriptional regulator n=1 Tax=unclassified Paenibacillus TaxID=185978 RepID=UPI001C102282|nr:MULTISPECIES: BlaI/MecI/CopY family transcriptional regulator [unclassified Paenibacillus]MBU5440760.1 BlaI/MecI/CopY family transcriptional regulator [Paenibacillus sp. MSJ-34]CAH0120384.1 Penicillinase repressor [Paenibacillus sp. CECT 9249]